MASDESAPKRVRIEVVYSPAARETWCWQGELDDGATLADALGASGFASHHPVVDLASMQVGVWGRRCSPQLRLREGDRVEVYRPLTVDPKEARRLRYRRQRQGPGRNP